MATAKKELQEINGIAPYGLRWSDVTQGQPPVEAKGLGYFGKISTASGAPMTELSTAFNVDGKVVQAPLVVPTLTPEEIQALQSGAEVPESVYQKAYDHAVKRLQEGKDPFATGQDLRRKYADGGEVSDQELQPGYLRFPESARGSRTTTSAQDLAQLGTQAGLIGLGFAPGAGMADYLGYFPSAEGGTEPSAVQNFQQGNYGTAALQGLGAMGDLMYAVPVLGATVGSAMKAPRAAQKMLQELQGSRVVNQSGEPLTVYHGTSAKDLKEFDTAKKGAWFSEDPYIAEAYTRREGADAGTVIPAKLNVQNPLIVPQDIDMSKRYSVDEIINRINDDNATTYVPKDFGLKPDREAPAFEVVSSPRFIKELKEGVFDGIQAYEGGYSTWNVFDNKQITRDFTEVEAPSVMTRSDITELADYVKNREGEYGLRRVERAADEIPRLGEMYTQDALQSAFSGDNARALMTMNPADFEKYATPIDPFFSSVKYRARDDAGGKMSYEEYLKYLASVKKRGGFDDVPYLNINKEEQGLPLTPFLTGHEGRHRSRALTAAGEKAGLVQLLPRAELREPFPRRSQEEYIEALKREMAITGNKVLPQAYSEPSPTSLEDILIRRPAIDLPDLYAKGGEVRKPK
jgi:hypothetical protein